MEENKTTRVNRTVNYYSDRPDYDRHMEKHNCHCERPHYDHCPEKPEYDHYQERPHYDHCPERPEYDHHPVRPNHDHYPSKPDYDHYPVRPNYDHRPVKPDYDYYPERPHYDHCDDRPKQHNYYDEKHECNCHNDKHDNDYCPQRPDCDQRQVKTKPSNCCCPQINLRPNGCGTYCEPSKISCPDINCAVCTPILANKIFDFKFIKEKVCRAVVPPSTLPTFIVDPRPATCPPYTSGSPICIDKVGVTYSCIGFGNDSLPISLCNFTGTLTGIEQTCCTGETVFTTYQDTIPSSCVCQEKKSSASLVQGPLQLSIFDFQYIVEGFIGCEPFVARFPVPPNDDPDISTGPYSTIDLCGDICLPNKADGPLTLRAEFDLKFVVNSVIPSTPFVATGGGTGGTFTARIFDELLINEKLFVIKPEELVVYSSPDGFKHNER